MLVKLSSTPSPGFDGGESIPGGGNGGPGLHALGGAIQGSSSTPSPGEDGKWSNGGAVPGFNGSGSAAGLNF